MSTVCSRDENNMMIAVKGWRKVDKHRYRIHAVMEDLKKYVLIFASVRKKKKWRRGSSNKWAV